MEYYELEHAKKIIENWNKLKEDVYRFIIQDPEFAEWKESLKDFIHDGSREAGNLWTYILFKRERDLFYNRHVNMLLQHYKLGDLLLHFYYLTKGRKRNET